MLFELQPILENELIKIRPLEPSDFEILFKVASDPFIWEQHPNPDRYKREVFENYFKGAIESKGAFLVLNNQSGIAIGSSRYYEYNEVENSIAIGYTFLAKDHWGSTFNRALKSLMLDHAFIFIDKVIFHIGANNIRSQTAILKLGATKMGEIEMAYYGEIKKLDFLYRINKEDWA